MVSRTSSIYLIDFFHGVAIGRIVGALDLSGCGPIIGECWAELAEDGEDVGRCDDDLVLER